MAEIRLEQVFYYHSKGTPFEICALQDINVTVREGMITGIIGHTGSGKSTMVEMFNGLRRPDKGRVLLDGVDIWEKPKEIGKVRGKVGLVMQYPEYQLFEETIRKDIAFGPKNMGLSEIEIERRVIRAADFVGLDRALLEQSPFDLSGGQKRRAAIAGIIAMEPEILVLDEPAAGLDPAGREAIFGNIAAYRKACGNTVVIVSHSMEDMAKYCDRLIVLAGGRVVMEGTRDEVFAHADQLDAVGLDVPQITKMMMLLRRAGVEVDTGIYTEDAALEALRKQFT